MKVIKELINDDLAFLKKKSHYENFKNYTIEYSLEKKYLKQILISEEKYILLKEQLREFDYDWEIKIGYNYNINQFNFREFDLDTLCDNEEEDISLTFTIFKKNSTVFVIFDEKLFISHLNKISIEENLKFLKSKINGGLQIINKNSQIKISTNLVSYNTDLHVTKNTYTLNFQCNFPLFNEFGLTPENLDLFIIDCEDEIIKFYLKLNHILLWGFLFDQTIVNENTVTINSTSNKSFYYIINIEDISLKSYITYRKIIQWIYEDSSKENDRIGIARNVLAYYLKDKKPYIKNEAFNSIISANNIYIKENVSNFIETRNKVYEEVENITVLINNSILEYQRNFEKSILIFVTFFITNYIFEFAKSENIKYIFNGKTTTTGVLILILGYIYFKYSQKNSYSDIERITEKYTMIKKRFLSVLDKVDIENILNKDEEFINEMYYFRNKVKKYNQLWYYTFLILFLIILIPYFYLSTNESIRFLGLVFIVVIILLRFSINLHKT